MTDTEGLARFYRALAALGPPQQLSVFDFRQLPLRGVYFFFEDGEERRESGIGPRVVRVGTHALTTGSRSTLAQRLRQHRGSPRGGNHRGSIFRLLIGQATLASAPGLVCPSWGIKAQSREAATALATTRDQINEWEKAVEIEVSQLLSRMRIVVLGCEDEPGPDSLRGYVERNSIALLSAAHPAGLDRTSSEWLGQHSNRSLVVSSGLWNQRHTTETADVNFLERFQRIVQFGVRIDVVP